MMTVCELTQEAGDFVVVSQVLMSFLYVVEPFHFHGLLQGTDHTVDESALLAGGMTPAKEDHSLLADEDPLLVSSFHD